MTAADNRTLNASVPVPSARLAFRTMTHDDLDFVAEMLGDRQVMHFYPRVYNRDEAKRWIDKQQKRYADDGYGLWLLVRRSDGTPVGQAGIVAQLFDGAVLPGLGYLLHRPFWQQGYATESALACLDHGFSSLGFPRMVCLMRPGNKRSVAVARRAGLARHGRTRFAGYVHEVWSLDAATYGATSQRDTPERERAILALVAAVRRYLGDHPDAHDTLDGVRRKWLENELFAPDKALLNAALQRMIRARQLRGESDGEQTIYRAGKIA